jgi:hypothetical protein
MQLPNISNFWKFKADSHFSSYNVVMLQLEIRRKMDVPKSCVTDRQSPQLTLWSRAARWFIFKPKIRIWVIFGGPLIGKC